MNYETLTLSCEEQKVINQLDISEKTKQFIIEKYPEVVPDIVSHQILSPFKSTTEIVSFTALIEGVTILRYEKGKEPLAMAYNSNEPGDYSEYLINDEIVMMEFLGEVVIDRLSESLVDFSELLRVMSKET